MKKNYHYLLFALLAFAACTKTNETSTVPLNETIPPAGGGSEKDTVMLKPTGSFINGPYGNVTGTAKVVLQNGKYILALENVNISNGPDLHVYLSKEVQPVNFIDLGKLKSTSGNQLYDINGSPDFVAYKYALVHCQQYNHLFGSAELK
ncbi:MAG: DM13 domain-containing protein [Chitinophagaceae bacterium]